MGAAVPVLTIRVRPATRRVFGSGSGVRNQPGPRSLCFRTLGLSVPARLACETSRPDPSAICSAGQHQTLFANS